MAGLEVGPLIWRCHK